MSNEPIFKPYVPPDESPSEMTLRAIALGSVLGILFAASSVYLALKVGMTVSASIPIAVLSITIFRAFGRATILENNIVQTTGSAGESIAAGVAFTLPALLLMAHELELLRVLTISLLGGVLGVLMMIPLRRGLIVEEHGRLTYPEGTACADVLIAGDQGGTKALHVFLGFFLGVGYSVLNLILKLWRDTASFTSRTVFKGATIAAEVSPALLGVGYIIGPRVAANMMAGGLLAYVVLVPLIYVFGDASPSALFPANKLIRDMEPGEIRDAYILYIGAGAVATGGIVSLLRALPTIAGAFCRGVRVFLAARRGALSESPLRTERDLPMSVVAFGSLGLVLAIWAAPILEINALSAMLIVLFGFFFVTVSSRITGEIGSSSNPISGMTVATLLLTCLLFLAVGWTGVSYRAMALSTAAIVCIAASNGGTISQDLKTGFLVGGTPRRQQLAILVGVVTSALVIGFTLLFLNEAAVTCAPLAPSAYSAEPEPGAAREKGPDGRLYRVHFVPERKGDLVPGKYLADEEGRLAFLVDPGVCGRYPWKWRPVLYGSFTAPEEALEAAPRELGPDRRSYRVLVLDAPSGEVASGRYLVGEDGRIAYSAVEVKKFDAPKAQMFALIIDGILTRRLPWGLVLVGVSLALMMELLGVSSLPFAVGCYLPISTSTPIFLGGLIRALVDRVRVQSAIGAAARGAEDNNSANAAPPSEFSSGVLLSSGLIAGGAIGGLAYSAIAGAEWDRLFDRSNWTAPFATSDAFALAPFLALAAVLALVALGPARRNGA